MKVIRALCPRCERWIVCDKDEKFVSHDGFEVTGSHIEYGTCKLSGKKALPNYKQDNGYCLSDH